MSQSQGSHRAVRGSTSSSGSTGVHAAPPQGPYEQLYEAPYGALHEQSYGAAAQAAQAAQHGAPPSYGSYGGSDAYGGAYAPHGSAVAYGGHGAHSPHSAHGAYGGGAYGGHGAQEHYGGVGALQPPPAGAPYDAYGTGYGAGPHALRPEPPAAYPHAPAVDPNAPDTAELPAVRDSAPRAVPDAPAAQEEAPGAPRSAVPGGRAAARRAARARRTAERPEVLRRLLPQALVVAFLAGGTSAFVAHDKAVKLSVDGTPRTLHTFADDVGELLEDEGVGVNAHDIVAPSPAQELANGTEVAVRYGRPLSLTLDGRRQRVWTTARTVDGALEQLGVRAQGAYLSVSRGAPIGRHGLDLDVRTERGVTVVADGREHTIRTNAATVREAVRQAGVELRADDTTSVPLDSFPRDGQSVSVLRITGGEKIEEERVPFETVRREDPELNQGTEVVVHEGRPGLRRITYRLRTVNGVRQKPRRVGSELVRRPQKRLIKVGTKPLPQSVQGADGLNWGALAQCESGGRPDAVDASGTYGGLYQFDTHTWHSLGGSGRPQDAPGGEQTYRAKKLYVARGASPWPHCGSKLAP